MHKSKIEKQKRLKYLKDANEIDENFTFKPDISKNPNKLKAPPIEIKPHEKHQIMKEMVAEEEK